MPLYLILTVLILYGYSIYTVYYTIYAIVFLCSINYATYIDCGDGFVAIYIYRILPNYIF